MWQCKIRLFNLRQRATLPPASNARLINKSCDYPFQANSEHLSLHFPFLRPAYYNMHSPTVTYGDMRGWSNMSTVFVPCSWATSKKLVINRIERRCRRKDFIYSNAYLPDLIQYGSVPHDSHNERCISIDLGGTRSGWAVIRSSLGVLCRFHQWAPEWGQVI